MPGERMRHVIQSAHESSLFTFMLTLARPPADELKHQDRGRKYLYLKQSAYQIREQLVAWIDENGLSDDVAQVGQPTVFNTLFVTSTRRAAEQLTRAPGVVDVAPSGEVGIDLLADSQEQDNDPQAAPDQEGGGRTTTDFENSGWD